MAWAAKVGDRRHNRRMDRYERIIGLHRVLQASRRPVTVARLQDELGCSRATVYRDLAFLRDGLMAPLVGDGEAGFSYDKDEAGRFELPGLWLNSEELHALLAAQQLLSRSSGGMLSAALAPLQQRVEKLLDAHSGGKTWPVERVRVIPHRLRRMDEHAFRIVASSVLERRKLAFDYRARSTDEKTRRNVSAAAPDPLPRQLVPGCLGRGEAGVAQLLDRPHHRRAIRRWRGARRGRRGTQRAPGRQLRHFLRRAEGLGDDPVQRQGRALGGRRTLAFAAAGPLPAGRALRTEGAVRCRASC